MTTTPWQRLDPDIAIGVICIEEDDAPGTPLSAAWQAEILARLHEGEEEVFLGSPEEVAVRMRQGLH